MVEALGLAGMTEIPVVAVDAHRSGPATGLPTRMKQGDLEFVGGLTFFTPQPAQHVIRGTRACR